ncbi:MAG: PIG-L family deacetylase [Clostridiales bacterium]|nr:PIG-L family deacetylase [Clostridiales bacterium]
MKLRRLVSLLLAAVTIGISVSMAEPFDMAFCEKSFHLAGELVSGAKRGGIFAEPDSDKTPIGYFYSGDILEVIGVEGRFYVIKHGDGTAYAAKSKVKLSGVAGEDTPISGIVLTSSIKIAKVIFRPVDDDEDRVVLEGEMELSEPVQQLVFYLWDERQLNIEQSVLYTLDEPATRLTGADWTRKLKTERMKPGRKTLCVQAMKDGREEVLFRGPFYIAGREDDPVNLTSKCTFSPKEERLTDKRVDSYWSPTNKHPELTVTLPEDEPASLIQMEWYQPPEKVDVTVMGAGDTILSSQTLETGFYLDSVTLPEDARKVVIHPYGKKIRLSSVRVYGKEYPHDMVQEWQELPDKLDMMVFSAHQDDELLFYAGLIPWYSHLGKKLAMVYMADCGRKRYREAMDGMWTAGLRYHPVFLNYVDKGVGGIHVAEGLWPGSQAAVVRLIRKYRPDVLVTQDVDGEYGHTQHKLTSLQVREGAVLAADPSYDPESAEEFGVWEVKKVYVHLWGENQIHMDWNIPMEEAGGFTPWEMAIAAFDKHRTQFGFFRVERQGKQYDATLFGLYYTTVGPDVAGGDMFENIN